MPHQYHLQHHLLLSNALNDHRQTKADRVS